MRLIDADVLYKQLQDAEELARNRVLDTESSLPFPTNLNPSYTRYSTQLDERTRLKHMVADAPTINPQPRWIPCSERPPEPRIDVWCNSDMGQMVGFYDEATENWYKSDYSFELIVDAWMPLPTPYQPKEDEE